jgi:hypothetical protein
MQIRWREVEPVFGKPSEEGWQRWMPFTLRLRVTCRGINGREETAETAHEW